MKKFIPIFIITLIFLGAITAMNIFGTSVGGSGGKICGDVVPDEETAIRIAEAVWLPIYGTEIYDTQPFDAEYNPITQCWHIIGTCKNRSSYIDGGGPSAVIRKSDGKIISIDHGM